MKAMVLERAGARAESALRPASLPDPRPLAGDLLLKIEACGVCRTDLHIIDGEIPPHKSPLVLGHQVVGRILKMGRKVAGFKPGQRVGVPWLYHACGKCDKCLSGRENLCGRARFTGYDVDGGYAEKMAVPAAFAHPLPRNLSPLEAAPLLCAGAIGYRAWIKSGTAAGGRLGLYGFGASAHLVLQAARHRGCDVYVFSRGAKHRKLALDLGAAWAGEPGDRPPRPLDGAIIFAPAGPLAPLALEALDKGGRLVLAGIFMSPIPKMKYRLLYEERRIETVAHVTRKDVSEFLALASKIQIHPKVEVFPLEEAPSALKKIRDSSLQGSAVLMC